MLSTILHDHFNLTTGAPTTLSILLGVFLGVWGMVYGVKSASKLSLLGPLPEIGFKAVQSQITSLASIIGFIKSNFLVIIGLVALTLLIALFISIVAGACLIFFKMQRERARAFADFFEGGFRNIGARQRNLEGQVKVLRANIIQSMISTQNINEIIDDFEQAGVFSEAKVLETLTMIMDKALGKVFGRQRRIRGSIYLRGADVNGRPGDLLHFCSVNLYDLNAPDSFEQRWPIQRSIAGACFKEGRRISYPNMKKDYKHSYCKPQQDKFSKSFMCIPVNHYFRRWGVVTIDSDEKRFPDVDNIDLLFLTGLSYYVGYVVSMAKLKGYSFEPTRTRG